MGSTGGVPPHRQRGRSLDSSMDGSLNLLSEGAFTEHPDHAHKRLTKVFMAVLGDMPEFPLPDELQNYQDASQEEKSEALATYALTHAGDKLESWLGDNSAHLKDIRKAMTEKSKIARLKAMKKALKALFDKLLTRLSKREEKCRDVLSEGRTPEARLGHSPLKHFGYPKHVDGITLLARQLPLNLVNGFPVPIKVGSQDYYVQGRVDAVLFFFECFGQYEAVAETLFSDGHWDTKAHGNEKPRPLYVQVQGVMQGGSVPEIIVRTALHRVVKSIDFTLKKDGSLVKLVDAALRGDLRAEDFIQSSGSGPFPLIGDLAAYTNLSLSKLTELVEEMNGASGFAEKFEILCSYLEAEEEVEGWENYKAVRHHDRITVVLTSYPKPNSTVRATYQMGGNMVTLEEIGDALKLIKFKK
ncbi:hypothetical protein Esti_000759 [Eimeria stiedai]